MQFNYAELNKIADLARMANNEKLYQKAVAMIEEHWHPGTTMPPLHVPLIIRSKDKYYNGIQVVRKELLEKYSGYSKVAFLIIETNIGIELSPEMFDWRRV